MCVLTAAWSGKDPNTTTQQACSAFIMLFNLYLLEVRHKANGWKDGALDKRAFGHQTLSWDETSSPGMKLQEHRPPDTFCPDLQADDLLLILCHINTVEIIYSFSADMGQRMDADQCRWCAVWLKKHSYKRIKLGSIFTNNTVKQNAIS